MFLDYYGLREQPFGVTPDPRYLFLSPTHREALASLYYGIDAGRGFMALIAEPGMGKTTLLFHLLERVRKSACSAFLFQTQCDSREFLRSVLADMGLESQQQDLVNLHSQLNDALLRFSRAGKRFVLVIDEAQNLDSSVLETVRLLSNFETPSSKLIQILLSGQPQLADKLAHPSLVQLRQRIAILSRLEPFNSEETDLYIQHRLRLAGCEGGQIFTSNARAAIAAQSRGIPRNINNLCFNALSLGCALRRKKIDEEIVLEAAHDLDVESLSHKQYSPQCDVPVTSPAAPVSTIGQIDHIQPRHQYVRRLALAAALVVASLVLFPSVRGVLATRFISGLSTVLPVAKSIWHGPSMLRPAVSTTPAVPKGVLVGQVSGSAIPTGGSTFFVEVKEGQTLSEICGEHFGRFDRDLVQRVSNLNPQITNPNHIEVGQVIVLPGESRTSTETRAVGLSKIEPIISKRN